LRYQYLFTLSFAFLVGLACSELAAGGSIFYIRRKDLEEAGYSYPTGMADAIHGLKTRLWGTLTGSSVHQT